MYCYWSHTEFELRQSPADSSFDFTPWRGTRAQWDLSRTQKMFCSICSITWGTALHVPSADVP